MTKKDIPSKLFFLAVQGLDLMNNYKPLTKNGRFEAFIFNTEIVLDTFRSNRPDEFANIQEKYFALFNSYLDQNRIVLRNPEVFINKRFEFYANELNTIYSPNYIPGKLHSTFYDDPLSDTIGFNFDLPNVILFGSVLKQMAKFVNDGVNQICLTHKEEEEKESFWGRIWK